jgi:hypothetical protein
MINSIAKIFNQIKKIDAHHLLLAAIVILGITLRFTNLDSMVWEQIGNDESRDMLVAEHIIKNGEKVMRGPLAAAGFNWLLNSPIYFYLVAIIWFFTKTPPAFMNAWALLLGLLPIAAYYIGKEIKNKQLGLISAAMFALNTELIYESRQLLQPFLLPIFSTLFLWMILKTHKNNNFFYISAAIFFLILPVHFHYGVLLTIPIGSILILKYWIKLIKKDSSLKNIVIPIFTFLSISVLWLLLTYRNFVFDQFGFFILNAEDSSPLFIQKIARISLKTEWMIFREKSMFFSIIILFSTIFSSLMLERKKDDKNKIFTVFLLSLSLVFMFISNGYVADTYLLSILPFFLILISIGIYQIIKFKPILGLILLTAVLTKQYANSFEMTAFPYQDVSFYEQKKEMSKIILDNHLNNNESEDLNFALAFIKERNTLPFDGWGTSSFWFHLEEMTNERLTVITDYGVNIKPLVKNATAIYLICEHREHKRDWIIKSGQKICLDKFMSVREYLDPNHEKIYQSKDYTIWRFNIIKKTINNYNYVYKDLL